jgi:3-hydroxybutyrate dehydrogenase
LATTGRFAGETGRFAGEAAIAAGGMGPATAERLAAKGARVLVADLRAEAAEAAGRAGAPDALGLARGVSSEEQIEAAVGRFGRLDRL